MALQLYSSVRWSLSLCIITAGSLFPVPAHRTRELSQQMMATKPNVLVEKVKSLLYSNVPVLNVLLIPAKWRKTPSYSQDYVLDKRKSKLKK